MEALGSFVWLKTPAFQKNVSETIVGGRFLKLSAADLPQLIEPGGVALTHLLPTHGPVRIRRHTG